MMMKPCVIEHPASKTREALAPTVSMLDVSRVGRISPLTLLELNRLIAVEMRADGTIDAAVRRVNPFAA